jgi:CheY-like chemotaxis protein
MNANVDAAGGQRHLSRTSSVTPGIPAGTHILLAEDTPDIRCLATLILTKSGLTVTAVDDGRQALEAALAARRQGRPFDLIFMDMQMPVMDGYAATRQLRLAGYEMPIVALTAHAMAEDRGKCLDAGCDDYATKPIDRQGLLAIVAKWTVKPPLRNGATPPVPPILLKGLVADSLPDAAR